MRNNFVRCKDQQEPEEIEYRIEDSVTEFLSKRMELLLTGKVISSNSERMLQPKKPVWNTWWNCAIGKNFLFATLMM